MKMCVFRLHLVRDFFIYTFINLPNYLPTVSLNRIIDGPD